jgi:hypothetical protein
MAVQVLPEVFEVYYNGKAIDLFKIVDKCALYSCVCCVFAIVGVTLMISLTDVVARS